MLKSMTGYGRVKVENAYREILVEVRSVNHRYLDLNIKVPRIYGFLEDAVKKQASEVLARGKVDLYVSVRAKEGSDLKITPNMPVIDGYMAALQAVAQRYGMEQSVTPQQLLQMPDALAVDKEEADAEVLTAEVLDVLKQALDEHSAMRDREGKKLCEDIAYRADLIRGYVDFVEQRSPISVEEYRQRIAVRMEELLDGSELAQQRILNEAALFADKVAVTEEIVRLRSHLGQLESMLQSPVAVGRKVDFLVQELNRETNTIGSKANDYEIAKIVVEMKAEIEKIREQIQNLE
jgi:uncharacterized protein (TIGR00255 family)